MFRGREEITAITSLACTRRCLNKASSITDGDDAGDDGDGDDDNALLKQRLVQAATATMAMAKTMPCSGNAFFQASEVMAIISSLPRNMHAFVALSRSPREQLALSSLRATCHMQGLHPAMRVALRAAA